MNKRTRAMRKLLEVQDKLGYGELRRSARDVPILEIFGSKTDFNISYFGKGKFFRLFPQGAGKKFDIKTSEEVVKYLKDIRGGK